MGLVGGARNKTNAMALPPTRSGRGHDEEFDLMPAAEIQRS